MIIRRHTLLFMPPVSIVAAIILVAALGYGSEHVTGGGTPTLQYGGHTGAAVNHAVQSVVHQVRPEPLRGRRWGRQQAKPAAVTYRVSRPTGRKPVSKEKAVRINQQPATITTWMTTGRDSCSSSAKIFDADRATHAAVEHLTRSSDPTIRVESARANDAATPDGGLQSPTASAYARVEPLTRSSDPTIRAVTAHATGAAAADAALQSPAASAYARVEPLTRSSDPTIRAATAHAAANQPRRNPDPVFHVAPAKTNDAAADVALQSKAASMRMAATAYAVAEQPRGSPDPVIQVALAKTNDAAADAALQSCPASRNSKQPTDGDVTASQCWAEQPAADPAPTEALPWTQGQAAKPLRSQLAHDFAWSSSPRSEPLLSESHSLFCLRHRGMPLRRHSTWALTGKNTRRRSGVVCQGEGCVLLEQIQTH